MATTSSRARSGAERRRHEGKNQDERRRPHTFSLLKLGCVHIGSPRRLHSCWRRCRKGGAGARAHFFSCFGVCVSRTCVGRAASAAASPQRRCDDASAHRYRRRGNEGGRPSTVHGPLRTYRHSDGKCRASVASAVHADRSVMALHDPLGGSEETMWRRATQEWPFAPDGCPARVRSFDRDFLERYTRAQLCAGTAQRNRTVPPHLHKHFADLLITRESALSAVLPKFPSHCE